MKAITKLIILAYTLTICQYNAHAQSYNLGSQKTGFAYETLYALQNAEYTSTPTMADASNPSQPVAPAPAPKLTDAHKKEITTHMIQVQQEYVKLELTQTPAFMAYKKVVSLLMQSREYADWMTMKAINTLMESLTKENCTIDKTTLETQLATKTTPAEYTEVFKNFL